MNTRAQNARTVLTFKDGSTESITLVDQLMQLIPQYAAMLKSNDPTLSDAARNYLREVAGFAAVGILRVYDTRRGGVAKRHKNPKSAAMAAIKDEWRRQHRPGGGFARTMAARYQREGLDITEGGIKNAISRWRKES